VFVCTFAACGNGLFGGWFDQLKAYGFATAVAAGEKLAFPDDYCVRRAMCPMRNFIGPALGADVPRLKDWSETGAFHSNPRNRSVASKFGERGGGSSNLDGGFFVFVVLARVALLFIHRTERKREPIRRRRNPGSLQEVVGHRRSHYNQSQNPSRLPIGFAIAFDRGILPGTKQDWRTE
jgi:hypothetical protein